MPREAMVHTSSSEALLARTEERTIQIGTDMCCLKDFY